jgi:DNA-binding MarR family transcriptional regulator
VVTDFSNQLSDILRHKKVGKYLHPSQAAALVTIWALDGQVTPVALSRHLFLEPHSVSELIIRMESKGLVDKNKDKKKGNIVRLSITEKGRKLCSQIMGQDLIRHVISSLSDEQRDQLGSCLSILFTEALKELEIDEEPLLLVKSQ